MMIDKEEFDRIDKIAKTLRKILERDFPEGRLEKASLVGMENYLVRSVEEAMGTNAIFSMREGFLEPCPFCDSEKTRMECFSGGDLKDRSWYARCLDCGAQGPYYDNKPAAYLHWNVALAKLPKMEDVCIHDYVFNGVVYQASAERIGEVKSWIRHYLDSYYCRKCLEREYLPLFEAEGAQEPVSFGARPIPAGDIK